MSTRRVAILPARIIGVLSRPARRRVWPYAHPLRAEVARARGTIVGDMPTMPHDTARDHSHSHAQVAAQGEAEALHARDDAHEEPHLHARSASTISALRVGLALTAGFAIVEAIGGWFAGSLALISDAGHMATDAASFVVALIAQHLAQRPATPRASYGYARAEVLAAFVNALAMLALVVWIAVEAVARLLTPVPVAGGVVMGVAAIGLVVNVFVAWHLSHAHGNMNARGALLHVMGDLLGSVAALIAGAVIAYTGWTPIDPILSVVVSLLILRSTVALLRESTGVLMERVPSHLSYEDIGRALAALPGVTDVHDLHVWNMSAGRVAVTAHMTLAGKNDWPATLAAAQRTLSRDFGIQHVTLQPSWPAGTPEGKVIPVVPLASADETRMR